MGLVRHDEGVAAAGVLGLHRDQLTFLGYPDFRTLAFWASYWGDCEPCSSMFTRTTVVPYDNAFRPGTPYRADEILAAPTSCSEAYRSQCSSRGSSSAVLSAQGETGGIPAELTNAEHAK